MLCMSCQYWIVCLCNYDRCRGAKERTGEEGGRWRGEREEAGGREVVKDGENNEKSQRQRERKEVKAARSQYPFLTTAAGHFHLWSQCVKFSS